MTWKDLHHETQAHIEEKALEFIESGIPPEEAWARARREFGNTTLTIESSREVWRWIWIEELIQDARYGIRMLARSPLFTLTAVLSLAIGIGANTAIFTVANSLLFRPPDGIVEPHRLVDMGTRRGDGGLNPLSSKVVHEIGRRSSTLSGTFGASLFPQTMSFSSAIEAPQTVSAHYVSEEFFRVLGTTPLVGRVFNLGDSNEAVAVLNHDFWLRRFGGNPNVIGQTLRLNGQLFTAIGVAQPGFVGTGIMSVDVWLPLADDRAGTVMAMGRLKPSVPIGQADAEVSTIGAALNDELGVPIPMGSPPPSTPRVSVMPFSRAGGNRNVVAGFAGALMILVSLLLAVASSNVASIMLAQSTARAKEMALRTALGAKGSRLVRQILTETVVLYLMGGACGIGLAEGLLLALPRLPSVPFPTNVPLPLDATVIAFTALLSLGAALLSGVAPAFRGSKADPSKALKDDVSSLQGSRLRSVFVVAQVALSLFLIVMGSLMLRATRYAGAVDPGFDPHGVEVTALDLSMATYNDETRPAFWQNAIRRIRELLDVEAATIAATPPGGFEGITLGSVTLPGMPASIDPFIPAWNIVASGYFATLKIPLLAGREFSEQDTSGSQPVAIIGEGVARRFWPAQSAVGESLEFSEWVPGGTVVRRRVMIAGVAKDIRSTSLVDGLAESYVFLPLSQARGALFTTRMSILARSRQGGRLHAQMEAMVRELNPNLAIVSSSTVEDSVALGLAPQRIITWLAGSLGIVGLLLASLGIYGITAFSVARRRREIGIRMALGAPRTSLIILILRKGLALTMIGSAIGIFLSAGASWVLSAFFYGLPPLHVPTFVGAATLFLVVGFAACYFPVRSALGIDSLPTLHKD